MVHFGNGKPMAIQAQAMLKTHLSLSSRHDAKQAGGIKGSRRSTGLIHGLATFNKYVASLKQSGEWAKENAGLRHLKDLTPALAQQYLVDRAAQGVSQKQLDTDRNALEFVTGKGSLERELEGDKNALATEVAWRAGLRAHEFLTLQRAGEARASTHRHWSTERFLGRAGERYIVTGKGGLRREVMIPRELTVRLEARRLDTPRVVTERGITYRQHYDIGGDNAWSKSFSEVSTRTLGWSQGAHGLRHSYAQERMRELQAQGKSYHDARELVSQ